MFCNIIRVYKLTLLDSWPRQCAIDFIGIRVKEIRFELNFISRMESVRIILRNKSSDFSSSRPLILVYVGRSVIILVLSD